MLSNNYVQFIAIQTLVFTGADLGGGCRGCAPSPPPKMTCGFLIQLVFCKKKTMWLIGVEVEQETSAPLLKKILDPPLFQISYIQFIAIQTLVFSYQTSSLLLSKHQFLDIIQLYIQFIALQRLVFSYQTYCLQLSKHQFLVTRHVV